MIIDGHAHMGGEYRDLSSILKTLDAAGIDRVVLCPADKQRSRAMTLPELAGELNVEELNILVNRLLREASGNRATRDRIERGNERVFEAAADSGGRIIQFYWADPLKAGIIMDMESRLETWRFKGIKLHQCIHPFEILSEPFHRVAEFAALKGLPVFIHLYSKKEINDFISVAGNYKTTFITGHLIGLETFIKEKSRVSDNIFFDISCPPLVHPRRIMKAYRAFGPGRLTMGSDTPYGKDNGRKAVTSIKSLPISNNEMMMILGTNLQAILEL